eukprot:8849952-Pyramimonas_sp.AAC.2
MGAGMEWGQKWNGGSNGGSSGGRAGPTHGLLRRTKQAGKRDTLCTIYKSDGHVADQRLGRMDQGYWQAEQMPWVSGAKKGTKVLLELWAQALLVCAPLFGVRVGCSLRQQE